jgi:hypothetical protein
VVLVSNVAKRDGGHNTLRSRTGSSTSLCNAAYVVKFTGTNSLHWYQIGQTRNSRSFDCFFLCLKFAVHATEQFNSNTSNSTTQHDKQSKEVQVKRQKNLLSSWLRVPTPYIRPFDFGLFLT